MHNPVRVELVRAERPADHSTVADRVSTVQRLSELGHIDPAAGEVNTTELAGWLARINGVEVPVLDYAVSPSESGVALNLVLPVDSLSIGDPSLGQQPEASPATPDQPAPSVWGASGKPDPRQNIAGWQPEKLGGQVADSVMSRLAAASRRAGIA
uniref:hypothetical protein n=1 Tax=Paractinoplanes polyasparticus TaxID=2856853 RepID=UPI001C858452|nr:hypothetical protein [Actinoplanes polyasparticus]